MLNKTFFYLLLILGMSCTSTKKTVDNTPKSPKSMVLTVILEMQTSSHGTETMVKLLNIVKAAGHAKIIPDESANFEFRFVDSQSHSVEAIFKKVNLTKVYEYVDENGALKKKVMDGESVTIPIRTNYRPEMEKLVVYQMIKENYEPIATFSLQNKTK